MKKPITKRIKSDIFVRCALKNPAYARRYALKGYSEEI